MPADDDEVPVTDRDLQPPEGPSRERRRAEEPPATDTAVPAGGGNEAKRSLRRALRRRRAAEPENLRTERAHRLAAAAGQLRPVAGRAVAAFWPTNDEPDIGELVAALELPVYVPRVVGAAMEWVAVPNDSISGRRTGIPVPSGAAAAAGPAVTELGVGLMLVPALAVDPVSGIRLGYGHGYYDRLLAALRPDARRSLRAVAVCRAAELVALPVEPHDQPLDGVVTEAGCRWLAPAGPGA